MLPRRFKAIAWTILIAFVLMQAAGITKLCACTDNYPPLGMYLGVDMPEQPDTKTLEKIELAANNRLAGRALADMVSLARQKCKDAGPAVLDAILYRPDKMPPYVDPMNSDPLVFVCATPLSAVANLNNDLSQYKTLTFRVGISNNLIWENEIIFIIELDNQLIKHVNVTSHRRMFYILANLFSS